MIITFVTQNKHKVAEAQAVLGKHGIKVEQLDLDYPEDKEKTIQEIAATAALQLANKYNKPLIVEDTGVYFEAYANFPGPNAKLMYRAIGYEGLLKLVEGKTRKAFFMACVALCRPGEKPLLFEGRLDGTITEKVYDREKDVMDYSRIFSVRGKVVSSMTREEKNAISHRAKALEKLADYCKRHSI